MRKICLVALVFAGCSADVTFGDVQVIDDGTGRVEIRACLDAELFDCNGEDVELSVTHGGDTASLEYKGLFFPQHVTSMDLGDRSVPFVVSDGISRVTVYLPPAFEIEPIGEKVVGLDDEVALRWDAAGESMLWITRYENGGAVGDTIADDGALNLSGQRIADTFDPDETESEVGLELSRVEEAAVDEGFPAPRGTGIVRRTVTLTLRR